MAISMRKFFLLLALVWAQNSLADKGYDWHKVMGDIEVSAGDSVGSLRTVNGSIELEHNAQAESVQTTNGRLRIGDFVVVDELATVNGDIRAGQSLKVSGDVRTVNGSIKLKANSRVSESVKTVNGSIELQFTTVGEDVTTTNGDIELEGSVVKGDIIFQDVGDGWNNSSKPTLRVDADSEIKGTIYIRREVTLRISEDASVGEIVREY